MKTNIILIAAAFATIGFGCSKSINDRTASTPPLNPANIDLDAGEWKPVLLLRPDTFAVVAPAATTNPNFIGELNEIKGYQYSLTDDQKNKIKYWAAGGVLRWNETMRDLVAKYNLPPYQNLDGTYPFPNAGNPFAYPLFPFANPPYAARAYAYIAAAQYDALVACWHYKKLYNRAAPYKLDSAINANTFVAKTDLPSYPSEAAVLAGVTAEMMKLFFPTEIAAIEQKATDHKNAAIMSGTATRSDVTAGETLGRQIAQVFIARARGDRAGVAGGDQTLWAKMETDADAKGETPWYSLEVPRRPPMLPLFGKVKGFLVDSLAVIALRPPPPPSTNSDQMKADAAEVRAMTEDDKREHYDMVHFWADGVATYTPAGHWNAIAAEDFITKNFSEVRWARNMALLNMAEMDAAIVCWDTKYTYFNPRPTQVDPNVKTLTGVPNFPSYISGHATFSGAAAAILSHINPEKTAEYHALSTDAGMSRFFAGIHYRTDCEVGLEVGENVGNYAVQRALTDGAE